jgi:deoxyhypusine synthase
MASRYLKGKLIDPKPIGANMRVTALIEEYFLAYNAGRLHEACKVFTEKMLTESVTVGMSITGALTPAGLGRSSVVPLIERGLVDWIISTGANLYHDTHFGIGLQLRQGSPFFDDTQLREEAVIRIYDVVFEYDVLLKTDAFFREVIVQPEFQKEMSTAEFHYEIGRYVYAREKALGIKKRCILSAAYLAGLPIYTSSPGDSSIGMNVAAMSLLGNKLKIDINRDVNETAAIVLNAKRTGGESGVLIFGGGSPKNFMLQTEPQIQEVLGIDEKGHDYFLQITDARPDTGGLSGATPSEAVSWGKVDPDKLPDTVVCYTDSTIAMPMMTAYAIDKVGKRPLKKLYHRIDAMVGELKSEHEKVLAKRKKPARKVSRRKAGGG